MRVLLVLLACVSAWASDIRLEALQQYLANRPVQKYSADFLEAADRYKLDWKLLPCLSIVETSGGKHVRSRNNIFGWNSGRARFRSVREAIYHVAERLAQAPHYEGKTVHHKLSRYNPSRGRYAKRVQSVMWRLGQVYAKLYDERLEQRSEPTSGDR